MTHFLKKLTQSDILEKFRKLRFHHFRGVWCRYIFNVGTIVIPISNRDSKMIFRTDAFSSVSDRLQSESQNWVENWILRKSGRFKKLWSNFSFYDEENVIFRIYKRSKTGRNDSLYWPRLPQIFFNVCKIVFN